MKNILLLVLTISCLISAKLFSQPIAFERIDPPIIQGTVGDSLQQLKSHYVVRALNTSNNDSVLITITSLSLPSGWRPWGICTWLICYPDSLYILPYQHLVNGSVDTGYVYITPFNYVGSGSCRVTVTYHGSFSLSQDFGFTLNPIGIQQISSTIKDFSLGQNYPNPFNPTTKMNFSLAKSEFTYLRVYDILGREVKTLVSEQLQAGEYQVDFDAKDLSSGMYYYSLRAGDFVSVKKMVLVK